ncbi:hypothetical protein OG800_49440 (plasmid) [Streptomyces sp. NBC_00445]|uniref:hypothetical protein n=1 Tax=Streptomyces sp. NBC_00445 TaxID=2975745 RepID=UPI002E1A6AC8
MSRQRATPHRRGPRLSVAEIAQAYRVVESTAKGWCSSADFPPADRNGTHAAAKVDAWVRANRPRTWAKAQAGAAQERPASQTGGKGVSAADIAKRFDVPEATVQSWILTKEKREGGRVVRKAFPGRIRRGEWNQGEVDAWVRAHRPHVWAAFTGSGPVLRQPLPEGNPRDLLDVREFGEIWGNATRGEPIPYETMMAYRSRGQIPFQDREPDDGGSPRVFTYYWYREKVYAFVLSRRGSGRFEPR